MRSFRCHSTYLEVQRQRFLGLVSCPVPQNATETLIRSWAQARFAHDASEYNIRNDRSGREGYETGARWPMRLYRYVGPQEIADRARNAPRGTIITSADDARRWVAGQTTGRLPTGSITATFVVDSVGRLRLADRHSEHVGCAGGEPVRAAGEITLRVAAGAVITEELTNQSTGYCPEPSSWLAVDRALRDAGIVPPAEFATMFVFRRCPRCAQLNIVKDGIYECTVCAAPLPAEWNCDAGEAL